MFPSDDSFETSVTLETPSNSVVDDESFHILLLGDWSGRNHPDFFQNQLSKGKLFEIDRDNFEDVLKGFEIKLELNLKNDSSNTVTVDINEFDDFHPDNIFRQLPCFSHLRDIRKRLLNSDTFDSAAREVNSWSDSETEDKIVSDNPNQSSQISDSSENLLDRILNLENNIEVSPARKNKKTELDVLIGNLVKPFLVQTNEVEQAKLLEIVDQVTGDLMREILAHPRFREMESSWRGLYFLVKRIETDTQLKLFLYDTGKRQLATDLKSVADLSDTVFFQALTGNNEQQTDRNWAVICGNYDFNLNVDDTSLLMRLAKISKNLNAPFLSYLQLNSLNASEVGDNFTEAPLIFFDDTETKLLDSLRSIPESNYLGFVSPRILTRLPYLNDTEPLEIFVFDEFDTYFSIDQCNWMNPIFGCAFLFAQNFIFSGWDFMNNPQYQIEDLPYFVFQKDGDNYFQHSLKIIFNQKNAAKLMDLGFMTFISFKDSDFIRLARFQSISNSTSFLKGKWNVN